MLAPFPALALALAVTPATPGSSEDFPVVLPLRARAEVRDEWLARRLDALVPPLMRAADVDMWLVMGREYNEDPVLRTMLPSTWLSARRHTILLFHDPGGDGAVERLAVSRYAVGETFPGAWDPAEQPDQGARLAELVAERDPRRIAVNTSAHFGHADGLSHWSDGFLRASLGPEHVERLVSGEALAVGWLQTRIAEEITAYDGLCRMAHRIIDEGLSTGAVHPGITTTEDLSWWFRERLAELKLDTWFHPDVSVQRPTGAGHDGSFADDPESAVIQPGDLVHVDIGISYLGLNTDTQRHAYVLRPGETTPPRGLTAGLAAGNRLQDILVGEFAAGRTGNEVLAAALERARAEGLRPTIYTHPLGAHGHGAGATIGLWDRQDGVPGPGDVELATDTVWSIELNVEVTVPEWDGQSVLIMLEEDAVFTDEGVRFLDGRQQQLILIG